MTAWWWPKAGQSAGLPDRTHATHDAIKTGDWVIDLGPEGGVKGGGVLVSGTPETVAKEARSFTGQYLAPLFRKSDFGQAARKGSLGEPGEALSFFTIAGRRKAPTKEAEAAE